MNTEFANPIEETTIETVCAYCGTGCGITAIKSESDDNLIVKGSVSHPSNFGRMCSKGTNLNETLDASARLLYPEVDGRISDWQTAISTTASRIKAITDQHGPGAFAIYCSGQLLTEDYYVANKLMKGYIGSANIDTNSRLCMSSSVVGHKRAFGADTVPGCYADLEAANMVVLTGSNTAWCHPVLFQRIRAAKEANPGRKTVVIDPRRTATCDIADLHLALKPGTDAFLFNGLLCYLEAKNAVDADYVAAHTAGFTAALQQAQQQCATIDAVARHCDLSPEDVKTFYDWFVAEQKTVTVYSQGINQSSSGSDKVNAILNCHLATGRIGQTGMGPLSFTGQPNAMGGREVGGLANQLAGHLDLPNAKHRELVQDFWQSPTIANKAGLMAVDLFNAIESGQVKGVWIMATNPVDSLPNADQVIRALEQCELVIVNDCMQETDTSDYAHIRLPAMGWGEKDGTVTNSERRISRHRAIYPPSGESRPDWWIISRVAQAMGFTEGFNYQKGVEIFREHAALSAFRNNDEDILRDFNLSGFSDISDQEYQQLSPIQWPVKRTDAGFEGAERLLADGLFYTTTRRGQFVAINPQLPKNAPDSEYPLILNTGRIRDHWHTMTRTGLSTKLASHIDEPYVEVNPDDARTFGLTDGGLAKIRSRWGDMLARVTVHDTMRRQEIFVPMHWTGKFASQGRVDALVNPELDPFSGQPESKHTPVTISPYQPAWKGFLLSRERVNIASDYQIRAVGADCHLYHLADNHAVDWAALKQQVSATSCQLEYTDTKQQDYRAAWVLDGQLQAVLITVADGELPETQWLQSLFQQSTLCEEGRRQLLSGQAPDGANNAGPTVCACMGVGRNTLIDAITQQGLTDVSAIGQCTKAGTNCGSCIPEIRELIASSSKESAA